MRKYIAMFAAGAMASIIPTTPALAGGIVTTDGQCVGFVPTESGGYDENKLLFSDDPHLVVNSGWATYTCHFDVPDEFLPSKGVRANNLDCYIPGVGPATESRMSASPGGRAVATCRMKMPKN